MIPWKVMDADPGYRVIAAWALLADSGVFTLEPENGILATSLPLPSLCLLEPVTLLFCAQVKEGIVLDVVCAKRVASS